MPADKHVVVPVEGGPLGGQTIRIYGDLDRSFGYKEFTGRYHLTTDKSRYIWTGPDMTFPRTCGWVPPKRVDRCGKAGKAVAKVDGPVIYVCGVHANSAEKRGHTVIRYDVKAKK